jgi:hypothetical protein
MLCVQCSWKLGYLGDVVRLRQSLCNYVKIANLQSNHSVSKVLTTEDCEAAVPVLLASTGPHNEYHMTPNWPQHHG